MTRKPPKKKVVLTLLGILLALIVVLFAVVAACSKSSKWDDPSKSMCRKAAWYDNNPKGLSKREREKWDERDDTCEDKYGDVRPKKPRNP